MGEETLPLNTMGGNTMIFKDGKDYEAYHFPFNWGAEYFNGEYLTEFDLNTNDKNDFYSIQQHKLNRFGLFGAGLKMFYNIDGSFNIAGQQIEIEYHLDGTVYNLTSNSASKDCITYKKKSIDFHPEIEYQYEKLVSIDFGYKTLLNYDGIQFYFQPIVVVGMPTEHEDGRIEIEIKMTSNKDLNGQLVFKNKGKIMDKEDCPLVRNHKTTVNWIIH